LPLHEAASIVRARAADAGTAVIRNFAINQFGRTTR
jgi:hypothetical protein